MKKAKYPKVKLPENEPLTHWFSDCTGARWSVARLLEETKSLEPFDCPLAALDLSPVIWAGASTFDLAGHCRRVMDADLKHPILLAWDGSVADGRHRIIKAIAEGRTTIKAKRMWWRPAPDRPADN